MNKKITSSVLAAVMIAGTTSFSAFAAMADGTVVIGSKAFALSYANDPAHAEEITNLIVAGGAIFVKGFDGKWMNNATNAVVDASVIPAVVYKNAAGVVSNFDAKDMDAVTTVAVTSVSAINATQILVTFSKEVDKVAAETKANYQIGTIAAVNMTPVLQADNKSVVITTTAPISGTNLYVVQPIASATDATSKTPIFTKVETYTDTVAPVVSSITYPSYDKATVTFSEPLSSLGNVTITQNGVAVAGGIANDFMPGNKTVTFDLTNAAVDKAVTVVMVGAMDTGNNLIAPNPTTLTLTKTKTDLIAPTVSAINVLSDTRVSITFSEKLKVAPTVMVGLNLVTFVPTSTTDNITWEGTFASTTGVLPVAISAFADMSANAGTPVTVIKQVTADTTKPTLSSSEVKVFNNKAYLVLHFSETVAPAVGGAVIIGTRVKDYVSNSFTTTLAVTPMTYTKLNGADIDDSKAVMLDLSNDLTFPVGAYTVTVPAGFVQDMATLPLLNVATPITFTKGTLTVNDTTAPTVNALPTISANNKYVTVTFSEAMDYATALNVANYKVSGQSIFTNATFTGDNKTITLTVAPGSITYSGDRLVQVSGAKDLAGNLNTAYSNIVNFKEDVAPFVASAKLTDASTIAVTLSENVAATTAADFEVYVGGVLVTSTTSVSLVPTATPTITLTAPITDLSKAIQVKLVNAATADVNGNAATINQLVTVQ